MMRVLREAWTRRDTPELGAVVVVYLAWLVLTHPYRSLPTPAGELGHETITLISWWPEAWQHGSALFFVARWGAAIGAVAWVLRRFLPWSAWAAALGFVLFNALFLESWSHVTHTWHLPAQILVVHALWFHVERRALRSAMASGRLFDRPVQPGWVVEASVACIAAYHVHAGLSKLIASGPGWANGTTLQLLVHRFGRPEAAWITDVVLQSRPLAAGLQVAALVVELGAVGLLWPGPSRALVGVGLVGFYVGILVVFGWPFVPNLILVALFCLPLQRALTSVTRRSSVARVAP